MVVDIKADRKKFSEVKNGNLFRICTDTYCIKLLHEIKDEHGNSYNAFYINSGALLYIDNDDDTVTEFPNAKIVLE